MIAELLLASGIGLIAYAFYKWATQNNDYFTKRGLKQMTPSLLLGNSAPFINRKMDATQYAMSLYGAFPNERYLF